MGCLSSSDEQNAGLLLQDDGGPFELNKICDLPFYPQTPPIINNDEAIFLHSSKRGLRYVTLNLNETTITKRKTRIKAPPFDADNFDIFDSVYTYHPTQNKIHFIVNNKDIKILNLATNTLSSTDVSITTTNNNHAIIRYIESQNKIYIFGAENIDENKDENEYKFIPYSSATKIRSRSDKINLIKNFGHFSRCLDIDLEETMNGPYIYIFGGQTTEDNNDRPNDKIWKYNLLENKWIIPAYHLNSTLSSFGAINYENKYLITFGGEQLDRHKEFVKLNVVHVMVLCENEKNGLEKGMWYECGQFKKAGFFQAIYRGNGDHTIHLFSYDGVYYTMDIRRILNRLRSKNTDLLTRLHPSTEAGKTVAPTKSKKIQNMGPKCDSSDEEDEEEEQEIEQKTDEK